MRIPSAAPAPASSRFAPPRHLSYRTLALLLVAGLIFLPACFLLPQTPAAARYKFSVTANGLYRVTGAALQAAGADIGSINPDTLQLFNGDRQVAVRVQGKGSDLTMDFYGEASTSPYSAVNVYWLRWGAENGKRMREWNAPPPATAAAESFQDTVRVGRPVLYIPQARGLDDSWFWQSLTAPVTLSITVTLPAALPGPAQLRLNLWGSTADPVAPDHHLRVFMNNSPVLDRTWDGQGPHPLDAPIAAAAVQAGDNVLRLVAPGDTKAVADIVLLSSVQVTYTRRFVAQNDRIEFQQNASSYRLENFSSDAVDIFDITNPGEPVHVANAKVAARTASFGTDSNASRRWLAIGSKAYQAVTRISPMRATDLRTRVQQAGYVVITHPALRDAIQPLAKWRADQGLKVAVATTEEIYDEFGYGNESPQAVRDLLDSIQPAPRFVLLVGKASYDYRDYLSAPNKNMVPTYLVSTPNLALAASDNWYAASSATDIRPRFAIGRIPAKTPDELKRAVDKIMAYESAPRSADWRRRALFVTDDKDPGFAEMSDDLATKLGAGRDVQTVALAAHGGDLTSTRAHLLAQWNAGAGIVTYIGHGSIDTWAAGPLFSPENLGELRNGGRLPILFTPTCLDGFFYHPERDSLTEDLLYKPDGGIIAGVVPTGLSTTSAQQTFMAGLFTALDDGSAPTLGEALVRAKLAVSIDSPDVREVIETFGIIGDPALAIGN